MSMGLRTLHQVGVGTLRVLGGKLRWSGPQGGSRGSMSLVEWTTVLMDVEGELDL